MNWGLDHENKVAFGTAALMANPTGTHNLAPDIVYAWMHEWAGEESAEDYRALVEGRLQVKKDPIGDVRVAKLNDLYKIIYWGGDSAEETAL
ncbi:hypothetical protein B0H16DRAFT_1724618 [Mycena metata]|uniref:Uncharacterized protein n=1 Tax=Mycena metata TaxID=1033252 RepID=A0AAD7IUQ8_9AGAR|nr:hypothetical protein B0H16DRAFT_1724618 [Mycena metata]